MPRPIGGGWDIVNAAGLPELRASILEVDARGRYTGDIGGLGRAMNEIKEAKSTQSALKALGEATKLRVAPTDDEPESEQEAKDELIAVVDGIADVLTPCTFVDSPELQKCFREHALRTLNAEVLLKVQVRLLNKLFNTENLWAMVAVSDALRLLRDLKRGPDGAVFPNESLETWREKTVQNILSALGTVLPFEESESSADDDMETDEQGAASGEEELMDEQDEEQLKMDINSGLISKLIRSISQNHFMAAVDLLPVLLDKMLKGLINKHQESRKMAAKFLEVKQADAARYEDLVALDSLFQGLKLEASPHPANPPPEPIVRMAERGVRAQVLLVATGGMLHSLGGRVIEHQGLIEDVYELVQNLNNYTDEKTVTSSINTCIRSLETSTRPHHLPDVDDQGRASDEPGACGGSPVGGSAMWDRW